jgi:hypothetical protein
LRSPLERCFLHSGVFLCVRIDRRTAGVLASSVPGSSDAQGLSARELLVALAEDPSGSSRRRISAATSGAVAPSVGRRTTETGLVGMMSAPNLRRRPACHGHATALQPAGRSWLERYLGAPVRCRSKRSLAAPAAWATFREKSTVRPFGLFPHPATHTGASPSRSS